jgi:hypothetical protein
MEWSAIEIFLSPIVGNDAFPDNAFSLTMRRSDYQFSLLPEFEKQLSDNSSVLLSIGWDQVEPPKGSDVSGAPDLTIYFRQGVLISVPHELEFTVSPFVVVPTGNRKFGDQGYTDLGGELLVGKGFGDLPETTSMNIRDRSRSRPRWATRDESRDRRTAMHSRISSSNIQFDISINSSNKSS